MMRVVRAGGAEIPALGLGTWQLRGKTATRIVRDAIAGGYRHIDTARMYGNEAAVGQGIAEAPVARDDVFLTTKIWPTDHRATDLSRAAEESLRALSVDHVDLLLLHWPSPDVQLEETILALNSVQQRGLTRHIGVSNFPIALLNEAICLSDAPIVTNQVEYHPFLDQSKLLAAMRTEGVALTAYSPIGKGAVVGNSVIKDIALRHEATEVQVTLAWHMAQDGIIAIPRSEKIERVLDNLKALELDLSSEEMTAIHSLAQSDGRMVEMAGFVPDWD